MPGSITPWTSSPTRTAARQWPSPGSTSPLPAPCSPIPVSTVYAPMSTTGIRRPCGALTPCSPISKPCSALSSPNSASAPSSTKPRTVPTVTSSSPSSPTNWSRPSAGASPNTERTQVGHSASYPPRPAPCHRLLPPKGRRTLHVRKATRAEHHNSKSTPLSISTPHPEVVTKLIV